MLLTILRRPACLTLNLCPLFRLPVLPLPLPLPLPNLFFRSLFCSESGSSKSVATRSFELTRVPNLLEGCDYEHWLVVTEAPKSYPARDEIVNGYVQTLAMVLGSEEEAKMSIYSVSTKYYYAFGCKIQENMIYKIKALSNVKWVLPDSYVFHGESSYGGEPFVDGEVVPYDEKYHADWLREIKDDERKSIVHTKKPRRRKKTDIQMNADAKN